MTPGAPLMKEERTVINPNHAMVRTAKAAPGRESGESKRDHRAERMS